MSELQRLSYIQRHRGFTVLHSRIAWKVEPLENKAYRSVYVLIDDAMHINGLYAFAHQFVPKHPPGTPALIHGRLRAEYTRNQR